MDVYATVVTWAYIHAQLDISKKYAVHIANEDETKTLCGKKLTSAWELGTAEEVGEYKPYLCKKCARANSTAARDNFPPGE